MPEYTYTDKAGHVSQVHHGMSESPRVVCPECSAVMWRKPQPLNVSWGGLPPSKGGIAPLAQGLNNSRAEREENYWRAKADGRN